ncbi:MAG TPA: GcrA family cell cycle regulator, partial [Xanthobacteraceae bacterium]|nr:GcrA family cell cycle regulator [Xanthobacteraceae bacterium]
MAWNTETDELIKKLWADGRSASQIGAEIGVSRNAIIGRVHRLGLSGRSVPAKQSRNEDDARLEQEVTRLFKEAKFKIISGATFRRMTGDIVVEHPLLGRKRRYAIEFVAQATDKQINERAARFENYVRQSKRPFAEFDEFWLVTDKFTGDIDYTMPHIPRQFRAFDLEGLKAV